MIRGSSILSTANGYSGGVQRSQATPHCSRTLSAKVVGGHCLCCIIFIGVAVAAFRGTAGSGQRDVGIARVSVGNGVGLTPLGVVSCRVVGVVAALPGLGSAPRVHDVGADGLCRLLYVGPPRGSARVLATTNCEAISNNSCLLRLRAMLQRWPLLLGDGCPGQRLAKSRFSLCLCGFFFV